MDATPSPMPFKQVGKVRAIPVSLLICIAILYLAWNICPPPENGHGALILDVLLMLCALRMCALPVKVGLRGKIPWLTKEFRAFERVKTQERNVERAKVKHPGRKVGWAWATLINFALLIAATSIFTLVAWAFWDLLSFNTIGAEGSIGVGQFVALLFGSYVWLSIFGTLAKYSSRGRILWPNAKG